MAADNPTDVQRISPLGYLFFGLLLLLLLGLGWMCTQRGGDSNGLPGGEGVLDAPERLSEDDVD